MSKRVVFIIALAVLQAGPSLAQIHLKRMKPWLFPFDSLEAREAMQPPLPEPFRSGRHFEDERMPQLAKASPAWSGSESGSDSVQALWVRHYASDLIPTVNTAAAILIDAQGNIYVTGYSVGSGTSSDYATVKYNATGTQQWAASYNGPGNSSDIATALALDAQGNVYVTGYSAGPGTSSDYATIKYSTAGTQEWVARYNGTRNSNDIATALALDAQGNVYVTGYSEGSGTLHDYTTIKYNAAGTQEWVTRYDGSGNSYDYAAAVAVDAQRNVYVTGSSAGLGTSDDCVTIKYNVDGTPQWVARYNGLGNSNDGATALALDAQENVYVTGYSHGLGTSRDYATIKYNTAGAQQWAERYNGPGNSVDEATALAVDKQGNVYVTGASAGLGTSNDCVTIKYNVDGTPQWVARYNGLGNSNDGATALALDAQGNVYVTGSSVGSGRSIDYATIKYNTTGAQQWMSRFKGLGNSDDRVAALALDAQGNVYVTGESFGSGTSEDYATIKYNSAAEQQWVSRYNGTGNRNDQATALAVDAQGDIFVTGVSERSDGSANYATIKYNAAGTQQWEALYSGIGYGADARALALDAQGNVYVTGSRGVSSTSDDYVTIKYNATGAQQWLASYYNGLGNSNNIGIALALDAQGNVYVTGYSDGSGTHYDYATIKYNAAGVQQWVARYNGLGTYEDKAIALALDAQGNVYVTGHSGVYPNYDYATIKYDPAGVQQWAARYNGPGNYSDDKAAALALDTQGNVYVTGSSLGSVTSYDYTTVKYNAAGAEQWVARYNGPGNYSDDKATALAVNAQGDVYVTGYSDDSGTFYDYATIKYNSSGVDEWVARYNRMGNSDDRAVALALDASGKVYVTGTSTLGNQSVYTTIVYPQTVSSLRVSTEAATKVTAVSATLNGRVNPNNLNMLVRFEYGTNRSYGDTVAASPSTVTGANDDKVSANLSNLFPNTTYHYRVFATYSGGLIEGEDQTFQTLSCAASSVINHTQLSSPPPVNSKIQLTAQVLTVCGIDSVALKYRRAGDPDFLVAEKSGSADSFVWTIPEGGVTSSGVEYFIATTFSSGTAPIRRPPSGVYSIPITIAQGLRREEAQPAGSEQNSYRLISMPLELTERSARQVLQGDLGTYDNRIWRFFALQPGDSTYTELSESMQIEPGKAYFLIVKDPGRFLTTGPGTSIRTDQEFAIPLHPKWNFIGNPFSFPIPLDNLTLKSGRDRILRYHDGTWRDPFLRGVTHIQPFEGYAIFNTSDNVDTLFIDPQITPAPSGLGKAFSATWAEQMKWSIRVLAQCQEAGDEDNIAAIIGSASRAWDEMDQPEPPVIGEYVSVYFPHRDWSALAIKYCIDARPEPSEGEIWEFEVKTNIRDKVNLTFEGVESVPEAFEVWLMDDAVSIAQNLRQQSHYAVAGSEHPKRLKLVVGKGEFVEAKLAEVKLIPAEFELAQNFPNPFNPATTIRYGLPRVANVTLKVYNLLGEEVITLVDGENEDAGYHLAIWDGRNREGNFVTSGLYLYRIRAGGFVKTMKMALVK